MGIFQVLQNVRESNQQEDRPMKNRLASAGECFIAVCGAGAFAALLFTMKFAWSTTSLCVGAVASCLLGVLTVVGFFVVKVAKRSSNQEL